MGEKQQSTIIIGLTTYAIKYYDTTSRYSCFAGRKYKMQFIELYYHQFLIGNKKHDFGIYNKFSGTGYLHA